MPDMASHKGISQQPEALIQVKLQEQTSSLSFQQEFYNVVSNH